MDLRMRGKTAWVVGASGAIGTSIAGLLAEEGAIVFLGGRNVERLNHVAADIRRSGGEAHVVEVDVGSRDSVDAAALEVAGPAQRIDYLVNSTAAPIFGDFLTLDDQEWIEVINSKLIGYVRTMRAAIPFMTRNGGGSIVNISGRGGKQPSLAHLAGGGANAAVNLVTKGVSERFLSDRIRANVVMPGPIASERANIAGERNSAALPQGQPTANARLGVPLDVAQAVAWLLSERSAHITGALIPVDCGSTASI